MSLLLNKNDCKRKHIAKYLVIFHSASQGPVLCPVKVAETSLCTKHCNVASILEIAMCRLLLILVRGTVSDCSKLKCLNDRSTSRKQLL